MTDLSMYAEPQNPALPSANFQLDHERAALVITDPQVDFLSPEGVSWPVFGDSVRDNNTVAHIGELFAAAKLAGITVAVSPHYFFRRTASGGSAIRSNSSWPRSACSSARARTRRTASPAPAPISCPPTSTTSTTGEP